MITQKIKNIFLYLLYYKYDIIKELMGMYNLGILVDSLSYIEQNICKPLKTEQICLACGCSKSALEKIFRNINGISVHDYVTRRKMMYAALDISRQAQRNLLDIALD